MLKFIPKFLACTMQFPPLAGEKIRGKPQFLCRKINVKKFTKTELNSPAPAGERIVQV